MIIMDGGDSINTIRLLGTLGKTHLEIFQYISANAPINDLDLSTEFSSVVERMLIRELVGLGIIEITRQDYTRYEPSELITTDVQARRERGHLISMRERILASDHICTSGYRYLWTAHTRMTLNAYQLARHTVHAESTWAARLQRLCAFGLISYEPDAGYNLNWTPSRMRMTCEMLDALDKADVLKHKLNL